ncbi:MarR family winged helix-turn-helix transcriptional regulator [Nocardioides sp.]|uniref:MarR family winged helix-turn-helix transcriptional regulator n=1 Tax=Nocardioides sp. TaxID=35761 RepID=UPI0039E574D9
MTQTDTALTLSTDLVVYTVRVVRLIRHLHDTPADTRVLSLLDQYGELSVTGLARLDRCAQPTMSAAVAQLADDGLVSKKVNPDDARRSVVSLTAAGRAVLAQRRNAFGTTVLDRLSRHHHSEAELATAVAVLRDLLDTPEGNQ